MPIAYADLLAEVQGNLEIGSNDTTRFQIQEKLNAAQLDILNVLPAHYLENAIKTAKAALVNGQAAYQLPNDVVRLIQVWIDFDNAITDSNPGNLAYEHRSSLYGVTMGDMASQSYPRFEFIENGVEIRPVPDAAVSNGMRLRYIYKLPDMSATQDCLLSVRFRNLLIYRATALAARVENYNHQLGNEYEEYYRDELAKFMPKQEKG